MNKKLYVGNLAYATTEEDLQALFAQAGEVKSATVITDRETGRSKGFAFVEMTTQDEANNDLAAGRLDYVQADGSALDAFLKTEQGTACCELKGQVADDPEILGEGVGGGLRKEDTALKDKLNAAIAELAKAGKFDEITANYPDLVGEMITPK